MGTTQTARPQDPRPSQKESPGDGTPLGRFWQRISDGLEVSELWKQFESEARAGYGLYSADVDWAAVEQKKGMARAFAVAKAFFWAMLMKLSPARRVVLLLALVVLLMGRVVYNSRELSVDLDIRGWAFLLIFLLLALELADRVTMKRDLEIAREIQSWLVPEKPPRVEGLDIAFATRPANTVAGDYYDVFYRDAERTKLLLVVADVAGKSVPAALLMATFQACLQSCASVCRGLDELVARLNEFACTRSLDGQRFTTAFLAELDVATRTMVYVNAGHNAPVLRRVSGEVARLEKGGVPFGIDPSSHYETGAAKLERQDMLLIFTDGLVEAVNETEEEYGEARLFEMLHVVPGESAGETIRHILDNVAGFVGRARQHDDMTFLVMRAL